MAKLTQFILDGTFDAHTGRVQLYETGRALFSGFSVYNRAFNARQQTYGDRDHLWCDHLAPEQEALFDDRFQYDGQVGGSGYERFEGLRVLNPHSRFTRWRHLSGKTGLLVTQRQPRAEDVAELNRQTKGRISHLDPYPLINATFYDKIALHSLFEQAGASHLLPRQKAYIEDEKLVHRIAADWADRPGIIIKQPTRQQGVGLYTFPTERLGRLSEAWEGLGDFSSALYRAGGHTLRNPITHNHHPLILVQDIVEGRTIDGFQPTFRAVLSLTEQGGALTHRLHAAYWKFPAKHDDVISDSGEQGRIFTTEEMAELNTQLTDDVIPVLFAIAGRDGADHVQTLMQDPDPVKRIQGLYMYAQDTVVPSSHYYHNDDLWDLAANVLREFPYILSTLGKNNMGDPVFKDFSRAWFQKATRRKHQRGVNA